MERLAIDDGAADDIRPSQRHRGAEHLGWILVRRSLLVRPVHGDRPERVVALNDYDLCDRSVAQQRRALGDRLEHGLHVRGRARDHPQDLADRRLLLERMRELVRALVDLALETRVRLAQLAAHPVELVCEPFELVAGAHDDLLVELADAYPLCALGQRRDRSRHAPREHQRNERRDHEPDDEQQPRSRDRGVQLRIDLGNRLLDEHFPAERVDWRKRREDRRSGRVGRDHRDVLGRRSADRAFHVCEIGEVRLAKHEADVRIGNEEAVAIDDVGLALAADLDPRHDIPDELEVDVRHGDRAVVAAGAHRERHVRLGLLAKIDRPEPSLAALRAGKRRLPRAVLLRSDDVHAEARHRDLLAPRAVDLRNVGDLRRLAQQLQELDAAQLDVGGVELRHGGEAHLLVDRRDVLLDASCRANRLFVLNLGERGLVLLIREVHGDRPGHEQRAADEREDKREILAEQPAAMRRWSG